MSNYIYFDYGVESVALIEIIRDYAATFWEFPTEAEAEYQMAFGYSVSGNVQLRTGAALIEIKWSTYHDQYVLVLSADDESDLEEEYLLNVFEIEDITHEVLSDVFETASEAGFILH